MNRFLLIWMISWTIVGIIGLVLVANAEARPAWQRAEASYYVLEGNRTACGKKAGPKAWFVASLKSDTANCGLKVTICNRPRRKCVRVTVQDRGAWRNDNRRWDLQPRVKAALRCGDLCDVHWKRRW